MAPEPEETGRAVRPVSFGDALHGRQATPLDLISQSIVGALEVRSLRPKLIRLERAVRL